MNVNTDWKTRKARAKGDDIFANVISANQHKFRIDIFDAHIQIPET